MTGFWIVASLLLLVAFGSLLAPVLRQREAQPLLLLVSLLVPLIGLGLYLHFGARDNVQLAWELSQGPRSMDEMTHLLERAVAAQPDAVESLYFLGRTYMAQARPAEAAKVFERTTALAGRRPELLGLWAQARYFADGKKWSKTAQDLTDDALKADPTEVTSLGLLGIESFETRRYQEAIEYWNRLLEQLPSDDKSRSALLDGIELAKSRLHER